MAEHHATITIDMDRRCSQCRAKGAGQNGLCMMCAATQTFGAMRIDREGVTMGRRKMERSMAARAAELAQPPLIPMSHEEMDEAARNLAHKVAELEEMEENHAAQRKTMRDTREALLATIGAVASTIRSQGR